MYPESRYQIPQLQYPNNIEKIVYIASNKSVV